MDKFGWRHDQAHKGPGIRCPNRSLGDESGAQSSERSYGQVGAVQVASGKVHILAHLGEAAGGLAVARLSRGHAAFRSRASARARNQRLRESLQGRALHAEGRRGKGNPEILGRVGNRRHEPRSKGWSPHFLDEFVLIASGGADPVTKTGRLEQLSKPGFGPAPPQLAANPEVRFIHFGDSVVMIAQANPYAGKPAHISRVWVYRDGMWRMAFSYQTTIQSAAPIVPPDS